MTGVDQQHFEWDRYVARRGATVSIDSDGFLVSGPPTFDQPKSDILTLPQLSNEGVVVLLGMPGAGKSRCLEGEFERGFGPEGIPNSPSAGWFDLSEFSTDSRLADTVFQDRKSVV